MMVFPGHVAQEKRIHCPCVSVAKILITFNGDPQLIEIAPTLLDMGQSFKRKTPWLFGFFISRFRVFVMKN